jgi:hypothetical protein
MRPASRLEGGSETGFAAAPHTGAQKNNKSFIAKKHTGPTKLSTFFSDDVETLATYF